jgi:uncharacterized protein (DUF433 family)
MKKLLIATTVVLALVAAPAADLAGAADSPRPRAAVEGRHGRRVVRALGVAAEAIGIPARELGRELRGGTTIAEVAQDHDVDPQQVVDAIVAAATERIDAAVAAGKLDADRAATIKGNLDERVTNLVNREPRRHHPRLRGAVRRHARRAALGVAAETIGIEPAALREQLRAGKSVAEVAQAEGVDPQQVVDALVTAATERIDAAVAAGKLDADRAATIKDHLDERVTKRVDRRR